MMRCRVCGCTQTDACANGCEWVEDHLCSVCHDAAKALAVWCAEARRPNKTALWREAQKMQEAA